MQSTLARGGSFGELRDRHLFLFEGARMTHVHQRGDGAEVRHQSRRPPQQPPARKWRTSGILHIPVHQ